MQYQSLRQVFTSVVQHATNVELSNGKPLSPDFYIPGGHQDSILRTHTRLVEEGGAYAEAYRAVKASSRKAEDMCQSSIRMQLLMKMPSLALVMKLTPVLFPLATRQMDREQDKLFSLYEETPEAVALKTKPLPGRAPLL